MQQHESLEVCASHGSLPTVGATPADVRPVYGYVSCAHLSALKVAGRGAVLRDTAANRVTPTSTQEARAQLKLIQTSQAPSCPMAPS